ncbi:Rap1a/Tai family immunity protein [Rhodopila sp.]|uniref:Rap1a/Tai family immunity protein n=1 Tax=Rhodopila sp. TaxID=2480087 RepID=UPI003D0D0393
MKTVLAAALLASGVAVFSAWAVSAAWAAEEITIHTATAGELADTCAANPREPAADARLNFCRGFAQGAIDVEMHHAGEHKLFCFPHPSPSRAETMSQFVSWVRAMPDRSSMPSDEGLFKFLGERFPCK